jgi:hypothetical protein
VPYQAGVQIESNAEDRTIGAERYIGTRKSVDAQKLDRRTPFSDLIRLHIADKCEVGNAPRGKQRLIRLKGSKQCSAIFVSELDLRQLGCVELVL